MTDPMRKTCFGILADSVSEVVGNRSLVYIAVKQAALTGDISKERWADTLFSQVSATSRRRIRSAALEKAVAEQEVRKQSEMAPKQDGEVVVADLQKLFGGARPVF
jgi:hypothetical protein